MTGDDDNRGDRTEVVPYDQATRRPAGVMPKRLGRYTLERIIAQGGMAEIWLATADGPSGFQKKVVVKRIRPSLVKQALKQQKEGGGENRTVEMFVREARLLARLEHANIVQVFELGVQPPKRDGELGEHFIVMEYLDGVTLKDLALRSWEAKRPLPIETIVRIVADGALGLEHAHRLLDERGQPANLVHRDISPDNLLVTTSGTTKLLDFGIAKREDWSNLTMAGELKGKVPYMSPEQLKGQRVDGRTDIFALGVVLYWLLAGRRPFDGPSDIFTMKAILDDPPPPLRQYNPNVPQMLEDVVLSCLQKDPEARISSAAALHDSLSMLLLSIHGPQTSVGDLVTSVQDLPTPSFEVVPDVAAVPTATWGNVARSGPVPVASTFGPTDLRTAETGPPAAVAPVSVGPARARTVIGDGHGEADAPTMLQVDPSDVPSTMPPATHVRAIPLPISADGPTQQRSQPSLPPQLAVKPPAPTQPPPPSSLMDLAPPPVAEAPTRPTARPSWKDQVPAELRDTVDLGLEELGQAKTRPTVQPAPISMSIPAPVIARPPKGRSSAGPAVAAIIGATLAAGVLGLVAWGLGIFPSTQPAIADAGVIAAVVVDAGTAPVIAIVAAPVVDAGTIEAVVDAGAVDDVDAGAVDAVGDLPPGDEDLDDDEGVDGGIAVDGTPAPPPPRHRRRRPTRVKEPAAVGQGFLVVQARPWARVSIDGLGLGTTPLPAMPLPTGKHRVKLEHEGVVKYEQVTVTQGITTTIQIDMRAP